MSKEYPLEGVTPRQVGFACTVNEPVYTGENWQVCQNEFSLQVPEVGSFYVREGREVEYSVVPGADPDWVQLHLNGQVLVALLHQRKIISFHASSFIHDGRGVMVLGESGAGKSSLTVSFALAGAGFLSDDLTPLIFKEAAPHIWPLHRDVKLREDTVTKLGVSRHKLRQAEAGTGKQYLDVSRADVSDHQLNTVLKIEIGNCGKPEFHEPSPAEKFSLLRSEICSWEMLSGMPETEAAYLQQLLHIVEQVRFVRVVRPCDIEIATLHNAVSKYLASK